MRQFFHNAVCFILIALLIFPLSASAEDTRRDVDYLKDQVRTERGVAKAAQKSKEKKDLEEFKKFTYQDVLKQPDDVTLNYQYARAQIAKNDLLGASATLERILLINPDLHQVRVLQGVVLYRLGDLEDARISFESLKDIKIPDSLRNEVNNYMKAIKRRKRRTHLTLRESLGWGIDTNRNAAPSSKHHLITDVSTGLTNDERKKRDTHFLNITNVDVVHDLGFQSGHEIFGSFTYYLQEQTNVDNLDLGSFQYNLGGTYKSKWFNFTPMFYANHIFLSRETFLRSQGGLFNIDRVFFNKLRPFITTSIERQDFSGTNEFQNAAERKGPKYDLTGGASYVLTPTMRWQTALTYTNKWAKEECNGYENLKLENSHTWLLGKGQFLINTLTAEFDRYKEVDRTVAGRIRHDNVLRYRVTYGAPLTFFLIGKILPNQFKDITLSASYEYFHEDSNITNYTYVNNQFQGLLTKRWEF